MIADKINSLSKFYIKMYDIKNIALLGKTEIQKISFDTDEKLIMVQDEFFNDNYYECKIKRKLKIQEVVEKIDKKIPKSFKYKNSNEYKRLFGTRQFCGKKKPYSMQFCAFPGWHEKFLQLYKNLTNKMQGLEKYTDCNVLVFHEKNDLLCNLINEFYYDN